MSRKVVLVIDNADRDLKGIALLTSKLVLEGLFPVVTTTKNELSALIRHKPGLILMPHLRYERHLPVLEFARSQGTRVGILPVEGAAGRDDLIGHTVIGFETFFPFVDMVMAWGGHVRDYCRARLPLAHAEIHSAGCPRFDFLMPEYDSLAPSREALCRRLGLDQTRPIVTWFSSSKYANPKEGYDAWLAAFKDGSGKIIAKDVDIAAKGRDHQRVYDFIMDMFVRLAGERPDLNLLVKPHPGERREPFVARLAGIPNVRVLENSDQSTDVVRVTDIQINWRCMTSGEAWYRDLQAPVISAEPPGLEMRDFDRLTVGNDVVSSYGDLKAVVERYLAGSPVREALIEERIRYIERHFCSNAGSAAERCARIIAAFLARIPKPRRGLSSYKTILPRLPRILRRPGSWLEMRREPGHPKYFPPGEFHRWVESAGRVSGREIDRRHYRLEA